MVSRLWKFLKDMLSNSAWNAPMDPKSAGAKMPLNQKGPVFERQLLTEYICNDILQ